jgi:hypothetical protein
MPTTMRAVQGERAATREPVSSLKFRDRLRKEFDELLRDAFIRISADFTHRLSNAWKDLRRDSTRNDRPWSRLLLTIDAAVREDAPLELLLEVSALIETYIRIRYEQHQLPVVSAQIEAEENAPFALRKAA